MFFFKKKQILKYQITDLTDKLKSLYYVCLEDWSDEMKEAGNHKELWYQKMKDKGLGIKLAMTESGEIGGMIQYFPIEYSAAQGKNLYFVYCIWVHGYKKGRGNFQRRGMGKFLLRAAEKDVRDRGAKGIVTWGLSIPVWMRASWFKKQGYKPVDKMSVQVLLWKPFSEEAVPPKWRRPLKKPDSKGSTSQVLVSGFNSGLCPAMNISFERLKRVASEFDAKVKIASYDTSNPQTIQEWGITNALFINKREVALGPPLSCKKIRKLIKREIKKIKAKN